MALFASQSLCPLHELYYHQENNKTEMQINNKKQKKNTWRYFSVFRTVEATCTWADEAAEQQFREFPAEFARLSVAWQQCE